MNTDVWLESGGNLLRETLRQEARKWRQLHQPPATLEAWQECRRELLQKLREHAGSFPERVPLEVREYGALRQEGYRIVKLTYRSRPRMRVTANLYIPDGEGPFPGVLGVHGHTPKGKIDPGVAARGHTLAKEGFVVLMVDAFGAGERGTTPGEFEYHGGPIGSSLLAAGETLLGMQVYDNMRGIDLLQSLDCVDGERIGVTGASGGGNQTMWISAFDDRVKASVPVVSVGTFESYVTNPNCVCEVFPNGLTFMEEWAVLALVAPNALLLLNSLQDGPTFKVQEMIRSFNPAREVFRLYGIEEKFAYKAIDLPHGYHPEMRNHMLGWFKRWLKDEGAGWPGGIPDIPELPEKDLMCFPDAARPTDVPSIVEYATATGSEAKQAALASDNIDSDGKRSRLAELLRAPSEAPPASCGPIVVGSDGDRRFEKSAVETEPGVLLPCVRLLPSESCANGTTVIALHPESKAALPDMDCVADRLRQGAAVCLADLRNIGETCWDAGRIRPDHEASRAALWLGRTMLGDWVRDILALRSALIENAPDTRIELLAFGEPGLAALAVAALADGFERVTVSGVLATFVLEGVVPTHNMSIFVPNLLKWGDVSLIAALARCAVAIHAPVKPAGARLTADELAQWRAETVALAERLGNDLRIETAPGQLA